MAESDEWPSNIVHAQDFNNHIVQKILAKHQTGTMQNVKRYGWPRKTCKCFDHRIKIILICDGFKHSFPIPK